MAANVSKCSLDNMLTSILAQANTEQNQTYPPNIYQAHYNIATSFLISECVRLYPSNNEIVDIISPFVSVQRIPITDGLLVLPPEYRNVLGSPSIVVNNGKEGECGGDIPVITTPQQFQTATLKAGCTRRPIRIVSQSEFDYISTSEFRPPTYWDPIGYYLSNKSIKICPYDLTKVDVMFVMNEPTFIYGYTLNPDDTYYFNLSTSVESLWGSSAFVPLFKAITALYSAYTRDSSMQNWSEILNKEGIL